MLAGTGHLGRVRLVGWLVGEVVCRNVVVMLLISQLGSRIHVNLSWLLMVPYSSVCICQVTTVNPTLKLSVLGPGLEVTL